ncbi:MAG: Hsp20/alpha crystallin family protein [Verrucomicrobia bacterium]|nr:Hsp20/alpha crystallin family protein [Verrucomicrobiota bacterium]
MHTIIHPLRPAHRPRSANAASAQAELRKPSYDCRELQGTVKLTVYVPGVDASGVEIEGRGPDLVVTARKTHFVRVNWQALHLEGAQRDYQLRLRLGHGLDYATLAAEIQHGVLTISIPKRAAFAESPPARRVA